MPDARDHFTAQAIDALRAAIADAAGNEVFLLGTLDGGMVAHVRVLARGNRHAVPALLQVPRPGEVVIHNHPSGRLTPSDADLEIASALGNNGVGCVIVDNQVDEIYVVVEPHAAPRTQTLDGGAAVGLLAPGGRVGSALPGYEHRPQQLAMLEAVSGAFNDDAVLTVEAGTGTGKSFAYLVPAILWCRANRERVVVSTHTITLQEQLVAKDLPLLVERAGLECRVALVKGRGNYVCKRKAAQAAEQPALLVADEHVAELTQLLAWAARSSDGSLADLPVRPRPEVWEQVVSENDNCLRARCPHYSSCFFYTARRAAAAADVVVVNHHLLMADLSLRVEVGNYSQNAVLPPSTRVIVDEAHHLEDVATSYFGVHVAQATIDRPLTRLRNRRSPGKGLLPALLVALDGIEGADTAPARGAARLIEERLLDQSATLAADAEDCFARLLFAAERLDHASDTARPAPRDGRVPEQKLRITEPVRGTEFWRTTQTEFTELATSLDAFAADLGGVVDRLETFADQHMQIRSLATELVAVRGRLSGAAAGLLDVLSDDRAACTWIERRTRPRGDTVLSFHRAPIAVGPLLSEALFKPFKTAVLTSATLAVGERFDHLHRQLGIESIELAERVATLRIDSPFDFARQALLLVPTDLPEPTQPGYEPATHAAMRRTLERTRGGTFLLFTAYGALNRAWFELANGLRAQGMTPLRQGELSRHLLLRRFMQEPNAVLFATDSFWEGVDVPGDALRCVVITRLPFRVPSEPLEQARVEAIEARGGDPFSERAVPQAVLKLKQGFGRLIRTRTDRGCVVILDTRLATKRYGRVFLDSLPPAPRVIGSSPRVFAAMDEFYAAAPRGA